ncbi:pentatricopeptide repeat-containing protein At3g12770-like [Amborella trichopoda]|uniref:pentatricopeptide repeat-containing protein At3g12770-like n=1 Tax=Amborella trichopoda TaxID=13333 RepID=UPI0005D3330A|nr:pentatricopeptide repeat-containing protein At3g12770-like [Amborella trichopoda]|eukprot:XP_011625368.1 pentatricopeptide repeat-containing protein At3g12770-like [Amborella trichopoda]
MVYARRVFDTMPERDVFSWNTIIRCYSDVGPCQQALVLYTEMHQSGFLPDHFTFPFVVRSCAVISAFREGKGIHCNIIKHGFDLDVFVQTSLVAMYSQAGELENSWLIFNQIPAKNTMSWTAMVAGKAQNGFFRQALEVFYQMTVSGSRPNSITLVSVLPACANLEDFNLGKSIHGWAIKLGLGSDVSLTNSLIALYAKCKDLATSRSLFNGMREKTLVSWNAMIAAYERNESSSEALKLFRRMQNEKMVYDYITLVSVLSACANLGALNTGRWVHELIDRNGLYDNIAIQNALLDMYAKCGSLELAREVFNKLSPKSIVSWTAIIGAYAQHGQGEEALGLFRKMQEEGVKPNAITFTAILTACNHSGLVEEGKEYFYSMRRDHSIEPRLEHCACMVDLFGRAGSLVEAYGFVKNMGIEPDLGVWGALLGACKIHKNVEMAEIVAEHLFSKDPQTVTYYVLMSNIYAEAGRWEEVARLKKLIKEKQLKKIPGWSLVEINRRFHTFLSGPRLCPS